MIVFFILFVVHSYFDTNLNFIFIIKKFCVENKPEVKINDKYKKSECMEMKKIHFKMKGVVLTPQQLVNRSMR